MAWISFYSVGTGGLNAAQQQNNALAFWSAMSSRGFTACAAAAIWSNILCESGGNPQVWETGKVDDGFGLVQWTPATKIRNWATNNELDPNSGDVQCLRIYYEFTQPSTYQQYYSTSSFPVSASDFKSAAITSARSLSWWSEAFTRNYERPNETNFQNRKATQFAYAQSAYTLFTGSTPPTPDPPPSGNRYYITLQQSGSGAVDVTPWKSTGYGAGESVTLQVAAASGWRLKQINSDPELYLTHSGQVFTMPSANVTIFAIFEQEPEKEVGISLRLVENKGIELWIDGKYKRLLPNNYNTYQFKLKGGNLI